MNKTSSRIPTSAWAMAMLCIAASAAQGGPSTFTVPNSQIQALGIQTAPLQSQAGAVKAGFPAQVVVPPTSEQVVSSPVAGLVAQLLVQENQAVRTGTPLLRLSSPELGQLQLQLLQAASRASLARQAAKREQALFDEGIIPQRRLQEAQASLLEAEAALNQTKAALRLSGMPSAAIARVLASGKPQDSTTLTAAQAGIVSEIEVRPGQRVEAATALLHVTRIDTLWLDIHLPVAESANWQPNTKLKVQGRDATARILSASPLVAPGSQTVVLRAAVESKTSPLRPGEFVTVELPVAVAQGSWDVPLAAVAHDGKQAYLFVRTANGFEARPVTVAASAGQRVRVQGQLKDGEQIAVSGVVALKGAWLNPKESQ